jgi:ribosomal protein S18 acetylase RimI-like enzyme
MSTASISVAPQPSAAAVAIRPATAADYDSAARLFGATMGEGFVLDRALWSAVCDAPTHCARIAEDASGAALGLSIVVVSDRIRLAAGLRRRRFHVDELIVALEERRRGVGRALLEHVKDMARAEAPSYVLIDCDFMNVAARRTYEAAGLHLVRQSADRFEIAFKAPDDTGR